jgi:hypothetical protein
MTPAKPKEPEAVELVEKEVEAPPKAPLEWQRPREGAPEAYKFRGQEPKEGVRYRGAGPPRQR